MILVYSKANCVNCNKAFALLDKNNIAYEVVKVDEDAEAMAFVRAEGHKAVPQFYKDGKLFCNGFSGLQQMFK